MIKNIIFDLGQVLLKFDPPYFIKHVGIIDPADTEILLREIYNSPEWSRMDTGELTAEEAESIIVKRVPDHLKEVVPKLTSKWERPMLLVEGMVEFVNELKENGYKIYLLSNNSTHLKTYWEKVPGHECFDGIVISAEEHVVKPQQEIYRILCDRYNLIPNECVFIDDAITNVEAANICGMHAIVFHGDVYKTRKSLKEEGVKVDTNKCKKGK